MKWLEKTIGEITEIVTKGTTPTTYGFSFTEHGVNFIRAESISKDGRVNEETFLKISNECHIKLKRSQLKADDILFSIAGMALGKTGIVKESFLPANTNQAVGILRPIKEYVFPKFLQYQFINPNFNELVNRFSAQSAQPNINLTQLKSLKVYTPPLNTQGKIVSILNAYDELIENNLKRIALLEQAGQNIYEEWFVNMRFPGYQNSAINEETALPEGWNKDMVTQCFDFQRGVEVGSKNYVSEQSENTVPFLRVGSLKERKTDIFTDLSLVKNRILEPRDLCVSMDGSIGLVGFGLSGAYSSGLQKVDSKDGKYCNGFIYCLLNSDEIQNTIKSYAKGSTILHASSSIKHMKFNNAPSDISSEFNNIIEPIFSQMLILLEENNRLKDLRDILLPRLLNQTIKV